MPGSPPDLGSIPQSGDSVYVVSIPTTETFELDTPVQPLLPPQVQRLSLTPQTQRGDVNTEITVDEHRGSKQEESLRGEGGDQVLPLPEGQLTPQKSGAPQVIVRIRPATLSTAENIIDVDIATKTIQIRGDRETNCKSRSRDLCRQQTPPEFINFPADNILENSSQEDTFTTVAHELVDKAMQGISGMIVSVGPEVSGKSYSLFGLAGKYKNRGIAARILEKMFEIRDKKKSETNFKFGIGIVEVRREKIKDLLTLQPYEINDVGERGPKGMYLEELDGVEHGLSLLLRALFGQKLIHQEPYEKFHTIVYIEIVGLSPAVHENLQFQSKITLAEIASAPCKSDSIPSRSLSYQQSASPLTQPKFDMKQFRPKPQVSSVKKCCNPAQSTGLVGESIAVRQDTFALEQIFLKANETNRLKNYYAKLEQMGLTMVASQKRRFNSTPNVRHNKLAHCLKDILDGCTEVRILLHIIPDKTNLRASLEAIRFAERARLVPSKTNDLPGKGKQARTEDQILQEVITDIAPELALQSNVDSLTSDKMRVIQEHAIQYFENNIDSMKVCSKEKVKAMFENFRVLWNFLWELELNVSLRKAQDDTRLLLGQLGANAGLLNSLRMGSKDPLFSNPEDDILVSQTKDTAPPNKKSAKKMKRDKSKKKKDKEKSSKNDVTPDATSQDPSSGLKPDDDDPKSDPRGSFTPDSPPNGDGPETSVTPGANNDVSATKPDGSIEPSGDAQTKRASGDNEKATLLQVLEVGATQPGKSIDVDVPKSPESAGRDSQKERKTYNFNHPHESYVALPKNLSGTHIGVISGDPLKQPAAEEIKAISEEETALAVKLEEQISNNFEEMKKVARKQAIHLLRAGIKRPPWLTLF